MNEWRPTQKLPPKPDIAAALLLKAIREAKDNVGRLESAYHSLTGEWTMKYGLDLTERYDTRKPEDYVFGGGQVPKETLQPNGSWIMWLPVKEQQHLFGVEPSSCATHGTMNALEILVRRKYGVEYNWADRWLAKVSGTTESGNSPHRVAETLRKLGVPTEKEWPVTPDVNTFSKYYAEVPAASYGWAKKFLEKFDVKHEYVTPTKEAIMEALKSSPIGVSVYAWIKNGEFYTHPQGVNENHWCLIVEAHDDYFLVFDSYLDDGSPLKKVAWDYTPAIVKRYWIAERTEPLSGSNWFTGIFSNIFAFFADLWKTLMRKFQ